MSSTTVVLIWFTVFLLLLGLATALDVQEEGVPIALLWPLMLPITLVFVTGYLVGKLLLAISNKIRGIR